MRIPTPTLKVVPIGKLKPWEKNPRRRHAVEAITNSIEAFGYLSPIVVQAGTYRVLAGHGRLQALKAKGAKQVPVILANIPDDKANLYAIADNRVGDSSEFDALGLVRLLKEIDANLLSLTGFTDEELARLLALDDVAQVATGANKSNLYAGQDQVTRNDLTLAVVFPSPEHLKQAKAAIRHRQSGTEKTIGQIIYEALVPEAPAAH